MKKGKVIGGVISCAIGILLLFILHDAPTFPSEGERKVIMIFTIACIFFLISGALFLIFGLKGQKKIAMKEGKVIGGVISCAIGIILLKIGRMFLYPVWAYTVAGIIFFVIGALLLIFGLKSQE